jgi:hypothetical protein
LTGHYEFEIAFKTIQNLQKTIYRRYSDIEILHEGLIKYNPGSKVPTIPEKSIWCNLNVQNSAVLGKRKRSIEEYLSYVYAHRHLSQNPIFRIFISDDFNNYKSDQVKHINWIDKLSSLKAYLPKMLSSGTKIINYSDENKALEKAKEGLLKLEKGIKDINLVIVIYWLTIGLIYEDE